MFNSSGPLMLLKSLGIDPQMMLDMFVNAKDIVLKFAESSEKNHKELLGIIHSYEDFNRERHHITQMKLEAIHMDVKSLNPDHAGDLGVPVEINGDTVSIGEALAEKIDRKHFEKQTPEFIRFKDELCSTYRETIEGVDWESTTATENAWMEHRRLRRAEERAPGSIKR